MQAGGVQRRMTGFGPGNLIEKWLNAYGEGDVNRLEELEEWRTGDYGWLKSAPPPGRYLTHIKSLTKQWPHLQLLADFMDVGTTPVRWNASVPGGYPEDHKPRDAERNERMGRTRVTLLEYPKNGRAPKRIDFKEAKDLQKHVSEIDGRDGSSIKLRMFVAEDISREVIETLGAHYDVDPSFFREHLVDYVWYNIKDWWRDPPNLDIVSRGQNWFQMRFSRARYFKDQESYSRGEEQARKFNVYRLLQGDFNHSRFWDISTQGHGKAKEARVGNLRSRATFWMRDQTRKPTADGPRDTSPREPAVGILLLDPTIEEGHPLWRQYRNWNRVPSLSEGAPIPSDAGPPQDKYSSFFNNYLYWASRPEAFNFDGHPDEHHRHSYPNNNVNVGGGGAHPDSRRPSPICIPTQALLHLVCTEWLTLVDYIKTRLNQVDWEIAFPGNFLAKDEQIEKALGKLHYWRRVVPVYRAMLAETFLRVFRETKHPARMHPVRGDGVLNASAMMSEGHGGGDDFGDRRVSMVGTVSGAGGGGGGFGGGCGSRGPGSALDDLMDRECINAYKQDYTLVLNYLEEYQARIDRLTEVVTAVISIQDSRRGYKDNKNLQWLTWLATFFIPLSFVATMLSMTTDPIDQLRESTILWAEVSIPSGLLIMSTVLLMSIAKCRRAIRGFFIEFPWVGKARPFKRKMN